MADKFFDSKEYTTLYLGASGAENGAKGIEALVDLLSNPENREVREDVLKLLRMEKKAQALLLEAINDKQYKEQYQFLVAACWEAGIDCDNNIVLFTDIAISGDLATAIEAITVIEEMPGPFKEKDIEECIAKLGKAVKSPAPGKEELLKDLSLFMENLR